MRAPPDGSTGLADGSAAHARTSAAPRPTGRRRLAQGAIGVFDSGGRAHICKSCSCRWPTRTALRGDTARFPYGVVDRGAARVRGADRDHLDRRGATDVVVACKRRDGRGAARPGGARGGRARAAGGWRRRPRVDTSRVARRPKGGSGARHATRPWCGQRRVRRGCAWPTPHVHIESIRRPDAPLRAGSFDTSALATRHAYCEPLRAARGNVILGLTALPLSRPRSPAAARSRQLTMVTSGGGEAAGLDHAARVAGHRETARAAMVASVQVAPEIPRRSDVGSEIPADALGEGAGAGRARSGATESGGTGTPGEGTAAARPPRRPQATARGGRRGWTERSYAAPPATRPTRTSRASVAMRPLGADIERAKTR